MKSEGGSTGSMLGRYPFVAFVKGTYIQYIIISCGEEDAENSVAHGKAAAQRVGPTNPPINRPTTVSSCSLASIIT